MALLRFSSMLRMAEMAASEAIQGESIVAQPLLQPSLALCITNIFEFQKQSIS